MHTIKYLLICSVLFFNTINTLSAQPPGNAGGAMTNLSSIQFTPNGIILIGKDGEIKLLQTTNRNNSSVIVLNDNAAIAIGMNGVVMTPGTEQHTNTFSSVATSNFSTSAFSVFEPSIDGNCYKRSSGNCLTQDAAQWGGWCVDPWVAEPPCP